MEESVRTLVDKENLTGEIKHQLKCLHEKWKNSSGSFKDISPYVNDILTAKLNVEKVVAILRDYENLEDEVDDLNTKLDDENNMELLTIYRKLKTLNFVRIKLMERIENPPIQLPLQMARSTSYE